MFRYIFPVLVLLSSSLFAQPAWVAKSNEHAKVALQTLAKLSPEGAAQMGLEGYDEGISDLSSGVLERTLQANRDALAELEKRRKAEADPLVKQDLDIMITATRDAIRTAELNQKYRIPYINVAQVVFGGLNALLDDQVKENRRPAALTRLKKYAGLEKGYKPIAVLAEERTRERLKTSGLIGPPRDQVEKDLKNASFFLNGIGQSFAKYKIAGYEEALAKLKEQVTAYNQFVQNEVLPVTRTDFRLPPELYLNSLHGYGVDIAPAELATMAHKSFLEFQAQANEVARVVAKEKGFSVTDYRDVIRALKKEQLASGQIVDHYRTRIAQIEEIVRKQSLVTLPTRPARMRLASAAESAGQPAPNMRPPRLIGNTGESGEFILPLNNPGANNQQTDDFTFAAASWTLSCHEARPGHEMQFSKMVETGVSTARAIFAFNSTNVEGWGLYSEWMMFPYMPAEGQLISLQHRMMRAARAFLDPELQAGKMTPVEAKRILLEDVVLSDPMATQEVDRYTFRAPGQATSYYYGYTRLLQLRLDAEKKMGAKFEPKAFHDFLLSQGLLPPAILRKAVMEQYVR
ncbi:MAG: DUF885 domain-containing protein [Bryobacteraceae bacterium]|nr:DUF885 domain-containing protein [Bryobacteraceae bacterium]